MGDLTQTTDDGIEDKLQEEDRTTNTILAQSQKFNGKESAYTPITIDESIRPQTLLHTKSRRPTSKRIR